MRLVDLQGALYNSLIWLKS